MLLIFGLGKSAKALLKLWNEDYIATSRSGKEGTVLFDNFELNQDFTHILFSMPPNESGDIALNKFFDQIASMKYLKWIGYYSATSVYGDYKGEWVDENSELRAKDPQGLNRIKAEEGFFKLSKLRPDISINIFRLSGIYGVGYSVVDRIQSGDYKIITKKDQYFSRIHIDDIAGFTSLSIHKSNPSLHIYNVSDDEPTLPEVPYLYAIQKMGLDVPKIWDASEVEMTPMLKSFYSNSKKVDNNKMKNDLGYKLKFPTYKEGIDYIIDNQL